MPRHKNTKNMTWKIFFFFAGQTSQRFYTDIKLEAPDALSAIIKAEEKLEALDQEMAWSQWAVTGCKRDEQ
jgi:hypothetical protein